MPPDILGAAISGLDSCAIGTVIRNYLIAIVLHADELVDPETRQTIANATMALVPALTVSASGVVVVAGVGAPANRSTITRAGAT